MLLVEPLPGTTLEVQVGFVKIFNWVGSGDNFSFKGMGDMECTQYNILVAIPMSNLVYT